MGMVEAYLDTEIAMIRAGGFDVLGHPDLIKKNNLGNDGRQNRLFREDGTLYREKTAAIAALMAEKGIPSEVNTGGMNRGRIKDCYPSTAFLKLFRERGVPMIINADAHKAEDLCGHYEEAVRAMIEAGYTETLIFEGRTDGRALWKSESLLS